jgi:hypothetical protein
VHKTAKVVVDVPSHALAAVATTDDTRMRLTKWLWHASCISLGNPQTRRQQLAGTFRDE